MHARSRFRHSPMILLAVAGLFAVALLGGCHSSYYHVGYGSYGGHYDHHYDYGWSHYGYKHHYGHGGGHGHHGHGHGGHHGYKCR